MTARTPVTETLTSGAFTARWAYFDDDAGIDVVAYVGPGERPEHVRTWNAADRAAVLRALNAAYERGREDARRELRRAMGVSR